MNFGFSIIFKLLKINISTYLLTRGDSDIISKRNRSEGNVYEVRGLVSNFCSEKSRNTRIWNIKDSVLNSGTIFIEKCSSKPIK